MLLEDLELYIRNMSKSKCMSDDPEFNINDCCGGNYDEAYSIGVDDGYALLARELISKFFN